MHNDAVLRDVELRLRALEEARRLLPMVEGAQAHLTEIKRKAVEAAPGTATEHQLLYEAGEASQRLAVLQAELVRVQFELGRTRYLLQILQD